MNGKILYNVCFPARLHCNWKLKLITTVVFCILACGLQGEKMFFFPVNFWYFIKISSIRYYPDPNIFSKRRNPTRIRSVTSQLHCARSLPVSLAAPDLLFSITPCPPRHSAHSMQIIHWRPLNELQHSAPSVRGSKQQRRWHSGCRDTGSSGVRSDEGPWRSSI